MLPRLASAFASPCSALNRHSIAPSASFSPLALALHTCQVSAAPTITATHETSSMIFQNDLISFLTRHEICVSAKLSISPSTHLQRRAHAAMHNLPGASLSSGEFIQHNARGHARIQRLHTRRVRDGDQLIHLRKQPFIQASTFIADKYCNLAGYLCLGQRGSSVGDSRQHGVPP